MSITLVIIGLIVGGILTGRELIYAARLRKVGVELQQLQTAVTTFKGKYSCLPGDCANATTFFGNYVGSNQCYTSTAIATGDGATSGTCNGNGDEIINAWNAAPGISPQIESYFAWQQLGLAKMIPGNYPGGNQVSAVVAPGVNMPSSSFNPNIGYLIFTEVQPAPWWGWITPGAAVIQIGTLPAPGGGGSTDFLWGAGFNAPDAQALDTKMDDGNPGSGILTAHDALNASAYSSYQTCLSGTAYSTSLATGCNLYYTLKIE